MHVPCRRGVTVSAVVALAALTSRAPDPAALTSPAAVVIVTLDTTRADRLGAYGSPDGATPALDRLARDGVVFDQAVSTAPLTLPAHASLFTGLVPPRHGVRDNADPPLGLAHPTLAEVLRARGFRTGAFVGSTILGPDRGLARGFDRYSSPDADPVQRSVERRADAVMDDAIRWLETIPAGAPFLLWAHLYDAHRPYDAPNAHRSARLDPYSAEIAFVDTQVDRLLTALVQRGLLHRTIVVAVGDHGESLGEHGERDHGIFLYDAVLRVPLIVSAPGVPPGRIAGLVRITDLMPTILDLLRLPSPGIDGASLADVVTGTRQRVEFEAYAESLYPLRLGWSPLLSLRSGRYKYIEAPRPELYDLARDPFEQRNVVDRHPGVVAAMRRRLAQLAASGEPLNATARTARVAADLQARLAALGYVSGGPPPSTKRADMPPPDPKDRIAEYEARRKDP